MKRWCAALVAVVVCLSGCAAESSSTGAPDPSQSVAESSPSAGPSKPAVPAAAWPETKAGAIAFATFYWAAVDHAQEHLSTRKLRQLSVACGPCDAGADWIDAVSSRGGHIEGGAHLVLGFEAPTGPRPSGIAVIGSIKVTKQVVSSAGALSRRYAGGVDNISMTLRYGPAGWQVSSWHVN